MVLPWFVQEAHMDMVRPERSKRPPWYREVLTGIAVSVGSKAVWVALGEVARLSGL